MRSGSLAFIEPQLPTLVEQPPEGEEWTHEIKYDGYRSQIVLDRGKATIYTRRGFDWTKRYQYIADRAVERLKAETAILDGEMAATDGEGKTSIREFRLALDKYPERLIFIAFDLLHLNGQDLRNEPLFDRRAALLQLLQPIVGPLLYSEDVDADAASFYRAIQRLGMEGIVSKLRNSRYRSGRSKAWLKAKSFVEAEFLIAGVRRVPGEAPLAMMTAESGEYVGSAFVAIPGKVRDAFYAYAEAGGGEAPIGAKAKAVWSKPGLAGTVKFLAGEDHLRHATLKAIRPLDLKQALNSQLEQREAVRELLARLKDKRR